MKVLLLEDDYMLAESMKLLLESENIDVDIVNTAEEAYEKTYNNRYDLYIFDINLQSDENGIDVLKNLRDADDKTPTIFITALTDIETIKSAFKAGAEDFIKKPFDIEEVLVRIKSKYNKVIIIDDIEYDPENNQIHKDKQLVSLSPVLKNIFKELIKNRSKPVSKDILLQYMEKDSENALRVNISKLKSRLGLDIKNIRNEIKGRRVINKKSRH
jgi:DNA-binding response OmpR family regulator